MGNASTSVTSVRPNLTAGVAVASAGILAASLVAAPPEVSVARTEVRGVQLIAFALPSTAPAAATLEKFVRNQGQTIVSVTPVIMGAADVTGAVVSDATAQLVSDLAIEGPQVTNAAAAASLDVITDPILRSIVAVGFFFVVVPVFWAIAIVTSAINVVLGALGLPLLPNVPDPPFGPIPQLNTAITPVVESKPLAGDLVPLNTHKSGPLPGTVETDPLAGDLVPLNTHKSGPLPGTVETDPLAGDLVPLNTHKSGPLPGTVETDPPSSDPVAPDTDTANTSKPVMNVVKDSPVFRTKPRGRDSSSSDADLVRTPVETTADDASTVEQHPVGRVGKKPKPDAANEEQKPGHDPSVSRSLSQ